MQVYMADLTGGTSPEIIFKELCFKQIPLPMCKISL